MTNQGNVKLVVFVPVTHADILREAMGEVGSGKIGDYSFCSFSSFGVGRFLPGENTNPSIGSIGNLESVEEERIEVLCSREILQDLISKIKEVHPYEEVAYDVYPLENI